jgi:dTDP-4-dehydrorhamnose reductase
MLSKPRVLILGSTGFLGSALVSRLDAEIVTTDRSILDLCRPLTNSFREFIKSKQFNYIVISAAITDVEKCYQDQVLSQQVNVNSMKELLDIVKKTRTIPVFFSSDYVFSGGCSPYKEMDLRRPQTVYGHQKLLIENYLEENFKNYLIFRTSKLMSKTRHPKNILLPVLQSLALGKSQKIFEDQLLNPVFVEDVTSVLDRAFSSNLNGVFHLGTRRIFSRFELGHFLASAFEFNAQLIEPIKMNSIQFSEERPLNNTLNCAKIEAALDFKFCEIEDALQDLREILK